MSAPAVMRTRCRALRLRHFALSVALLSLASCDEKPPEPALATSSEPSPNASILPAPLASGLEGKNQLLHDAGEKEGGLRDAGKLASDAGEAVPLKDPVFAREDRGFSRDDELLDLSGFSLTAQFRWPDVPLPSRLPDANVEAIQRARTNATFDLTIDLSPSGRMRFAFASERFLLPVNTELRARYDIYGHAVVMPDRARYTVAVPGSLRALLNERRLDTLPLVAPRAVDLGAWHSLGFTTRKSRLSSPLGQLDLEQAEVIGSGLGGLLLCRLLVELVGVHPATPVCTDELVPVRADYVWTEGGRFGFEVTALRPVTGFDGSDLAVPPARAEHRIGGLIEPSTPFLVARSEFKNFRVRALRTPERRDSESPKEGLLVLNAGELPTYFLIDGVPVLRLPAKGAEVLLDLRAGTYSASARDFLSADVNPPTMTAVPARIVVSEAPKIEP